MYVGSQADEDFTSSFISIIFEVEPIHGPGFPGGGE